MEQTNQKKSRREFLNDGALAVAVTSVVGGWFYALKKAQEPSEGEKVKLLSEDGQIVELDKELIDRIVPEIDVSSEHHVRDGIPGRKWVMVFDLSRCKGAGKCLSACSKMHYLPPSRSYINLQKMMDAELTSPYWMPTLCFHCDNPPCVKVCPVDATFKLSDGIVGIDNERCIGCRFCMVACPYSERTFNWSEEDFMLTPEQLSEITPHEMCSSHKRGTVEKCDFCPHNLIKGELPSCVTGCPYGVIYFGDENEDTVTNGTETLKLSDMLKNKGGYRYLEELGTKPRVYYLPPVDRTFPFEDREFDLSKDYI